MEEKKGIEVKDDYLRTSFELEITDSEFEEQEVYDKVYEIAAQLGIKKEECGERNHHKERYKYMFELGPYIELGMLGPKNARGVRTCSLHLKGTGCRDYEARNPDKTFIPLSKTLLCGQMKMTTLKHLYECLKNETNEIFVEEDIRVKAKNCLDKMLELS